MGFLHLVPLIAIDPVVILFLSAHDFQGLIANAKDSRMNVGPTPADLGANVDPHAKLIHKVRVVNQDQITGSMEVVLLYTKGE